MTLPICRDAPGSPCDIAALPGDASPPSAIGPDRCGPIRQPRFHWSGDEASAPVADILCLGGGARTARARWDLHWTTGFPAPRVLRMLNGRRRVSHIWGMGYLCGKHFLAQALARSDQMARTRGHGDAFVIAPRSFAFPQDFDAWRALAAAEPETIWIAKEGAAQRGEGVRMVTEVDAVTPDKDLVLQEYVANPHLLDGFKYTLRVYLLVTSIDPLRAWVFPDGLTKMTTRPFTTEREALADRFVHLTNSAVLRGDTAVPLAGKRTTHVLYRERLRRDGVDDARLFRDIRAVLAKALLAVREPILLRNGEDGFRMEGQFMLLGADILVDRALRPWLIEMNPGPSLKTEASPSSDFGRREGEIKHDVATEMFVLAGVLPAAPVRFEPLFPSREMRDWLSCYERLRENDLVDLRELVLADARRSLDRDRHAGAVTAPPSPPVAQ